MERLLGLLLEQAKELAVLILDTHGTIRWWSPGAENIFGIPAGEAIGRTTDSLFTPEDAVQGLPENEMAIARAGTAASDDRWLVRADGSRFWVTGFMIALRGDGGHLLGYGKVLRDRTDLQERMERLRLQVEALDQSHERKDAFLSTLSHEIRNSLAPLRNAVDVIRMTAPERDETTSAIRILERQIDGLRRLVDDLLDVTRIGTGKVELRKEPVMVQDIVHQALESARPAVQEKKHHLVVALPPAPMMVDGDAPRLVQVFLNLILNAAKYTAEGGTIWVVGTTETEEAVVKIEDTGVGIPTEMLPRIFELFTQVETSRYRSQGGLGIGLALVKDLVTLHGGSVQVRSEGIGKGSEFTVRLPLRKPREESAVA